MTRPDRDGGLIRAYKHGWPRRAVHSMIVHKLRGAFFRVRVHGLDPLRNLLDADPAGTLFLANHSCWWDLFLVHLLNETIPVDGYGMMEWFNLRRFGFFRRIGAFSVDRTKPASVRHSLDYAAELLQQRRAGVWIFPQGRIVCNDVRPLTFQPGIRALAGRVGRVRVIPVAFRYDYWQDERPEAFVRFGAPRTFGRNDRSTLLADCEDLLTAELDALKADVLTQSAQRFTTILKAPDGFSQRVASAHEFLAGPTPGAPTPPD